MSEPDQAKQRQLAIKIAATASTVEKAALGEWIKRMLEINASSLSSLQKAKMMVELTANSGVILPTVKIIGREVKRLAWDDRGVTGRFSIGGAGIALALFGSQGAGIAALGTAIGVPLWVVFGAGGAFLGVLYQEITGHKANPKTSYRVIDADKEKDI